MPMTETGYRTRVGILLSACCVKCRVWIAPGKKRDTEFDGFPHSCNPAQRVEPEYTPRRLL
jgi:hypothetical protein